MSNDGWTPQNREKTSCVGDISTHATHLARFVSGLHMTHLRARFHVCGTPKPPEDTAFMMTRYHGHVPGMLMDTRLAPGNRGGLRLRSYGSEDGVEWDMENSEELKFNRFGEPDRILSRGHDHGIGSRTERYIRAARGFPEGIIDAWGNLYTESAMAAAGRMDRKMYPGAGSNCRAFRKELMVYASLRRLSNRAMPTVPGSGHDFRKPDRRPGIRPDQGRLSHTALPPTFSRSSSSHFPCRSRSS